MQCVFGHFLLEFNRSLYWFPLHTVCIDLYPFEFRRFYSREMSMSLSVLYSRLWTPFPGLKVRSILKIKVDVVFWSLERTCHASAKYRYNVSTMNTGITKLRHWNVIWYVTMTNMVRSNYVFTLQLC